MGGGIGVWDGAGERRFSETVRRDAWMRDNVKVAAKGRWIRTAGTEEGEYGGGSGIR